MISNIRLQNFRSYIDDSFEFEDGVNIIVGPNASGKTNLLESIMFVCSGGSYKVKDQDLISYDKPWLRLDSQEVDGKSRTVKVQIKDSKTEKIIELDGTKKSRMPKDKLLPFVLFEPNHLLMFHGGPEMRRDYIDSLLAQTEPEFNKVRNQYKRALLQRNTLLKSGNPNKDDIFVWNLRLSDLGGVIATRRAKLIGDLNDQLPGIYHKLSGSTVNISASYETVCDIDSYANDMLSKLERSLQSDIMRGFTVVGPHRDDLQIKLKNHNIKETASRGEIRTIVLSLKIFENLELSKKTEKDPIFLLDDVFSELDGARRRSLTDFLSGHQVFITTTDADVVVQHFTDKCNVIALV